MKISFFLAILVLSNFCFGQTASQERRPLVLTIVYDNYAHNPELKTAWGFACLVEGLEKTILFDTGGDGPTLLSNMAKLKIDPKSIDIVVLSHSHYDHTGGLAAFLKENSAVKLFMPASFPRRIKSRAREAGAEVVEVNDFCQIIEGAYSTGQMGRLIKEQGLIIESAKGAVVITGCAHPGIVKMIETAKEKTGRDIHLVMGGFHLTGAPTSQIKSIIEEFRHLDVRKVAPCHCSGDETRHLFRKEYAEDYIESGVGTIIILP